MYVHTYGMWSFPVRHPHCVEYKLKYNIKYIQYSDTQPYILLDILDYNSSYMFQPYCKAIFRLIFEQVECTNDNAWNLQDLVLQELVKIPVVSYIKTILVMQDLINWKHY